MTRIPLTHGNYRRVSEPRSAILGARIRSDSRCGVASRIERVVDIECSCGERITCQLSTWLRRPPTCCIKCHGVRRRRSA